MVDRVQLQLIVIQLQILAVLHQLVHAQVVTPGRLVQKPVHQNHVINSTLKK